MTHDRHLACEEERTEVAELLVEYGASLTSVNKVFIRLILWMCTGWPTNWKSEILKFSIFARS